MKSVVVVDDEPLICMMMADLLQDAGHQVCDFRLAVSAKAYCDDLANPIDTIITDVKMPGGMDGVELARHVLASRPQTRIIIMSGFNEACLDGLTGVTYLAKPWTAAMMLDLVASG